jgi:hypothetical protein
VGKNTRIKITAMPVFKLLLLVQHHLDNLEITGPKLARWLCQVIPAQCPFERDISLFGHHLFRIPPLCKLNPCYEQLIGLRWRALCYLADECGEFVV